MRLIDADAIKIKPVYMHDICGVVMIRVEDIARILNDMPTISPEPERKTGKWIDGKRMKHDGTFYWFRQCDQCGYERNDCDTEKDSNFCPDCGADMREGQDGE